jgi:hypothetical protein
MTPTTWIAELPVVFVHANGRREDGRIAVGLPFVVDEHQKSCAVALDGMDRGGVISGGDTLQALLLAVRFLAMRLHDFTSKGGRVLYRGDAGDEVPLDAFFGALLAHPT